MKYLKQIAQTIGEGKKDKEIHKTCKDRKAEIETEISNLSEQDVDEIICLLFPSRIPTTSSFYDTLQNYQNYTGYGTTFYNFVGRIWVQVFNKLTQVKQKNLLNSVFEDKGRSVWRVIFYLPEFCRQVEIDPQFAAGWFYRFGDKVKNDMASGGFFSGLTQYALNFPDSGMKVFEEYLSKDLDELKIHLAAILIGTIRSRASQKHFDKKTVQKWDQKLQKSSKTEFRIIYNKSLATSFDLGTLSVSQLNPKLNKMLQGDPKEIDEAYNTVYKGLLSKSSNDKFVRFAMDWFSRNASSELPPLAKFYIVSAMWSICMTESEKRIVKESEANEVLTAIQPIPTDNRGTWDKIEQILVNRLHQGPNEFQDLLSKLTEVNFEGILEQFQRGTFEYLKSELDAAEVGELMSSWLISKDRRRRQIGRLIFQDTEMSSISEKVLLKAEERELELALLEFIRKPPLAEKTSAYLLALEPAFRTARASLKEKFKREMALQAINYPAACLESWKKIKKPPDLLREAIKNGEEYFEKLKATKDSPAIAFAFPGCKEAAEKEVREFSSGVSQAARDKSVFAKLVKNVQVIYGSTWSVMIGGRLGEASGFHEFSGSMEFPRLEGIDPEGMAMRRIEAGSSIMEVERAK